MPESAYEVQGGQTMHGSKTTRNLKGILVTLLSASFLGLTGCGGGSSEERSLMRNFFTASRVNDRATLGNIAMVSFDPQQDGTIGSFDVENVTEEQRRPLRMVELAAVVSQAQQDQQEFADKMKMYQDEHLDAIARVIEAERADEDVTGTDDEVQEEWTQWRDDSQERSRAVSDAQNALSLESSVAQVSAFNPNNPIDIQAFEGSLVTKEVTINASVERNDDSEDRTMLITFQKVELDGPDGMIEGRWVIANIG